MPNIFTLDFNLIHPESDPRKANFHDAMLAVPANPTPLYKNVQGPERIWTQMPDCGDGSRIAFVRCKYGGDWEMGPSICSLDGTTLGSPDSSVYDQHHDGFGVRLPFYSNYPQMMFYSLGCVYKEGHWRPDLPWKQAIGRPIGDHVFGFWTGEHPNSPIPPDGQQGNSTPDCVVQIVW